MPIFYCSIWFSLVLCVPSVLWHCWLGHLTRKNPSPIWPIMCWWDVTPYSISQSINLWWVHGRGKPFVVLGLSMMFEVSGDVKYRPGTAISVPGKSWKSGKPLVWSLLIVVNNVDSEMANWQHCVCWRSGAGAGGNVWHPAVSAAGLWWWRGRRLQGAVSTAQGCLSVICHWLNAYNSLY